MFRTNSKHSSSNAFESFQGKFDGTAIHSYTQLVTAMRVMNMVFHLCHWLFHSVSRTCRCHAAVLLCLVPFAACWPKLLLNLLLLVALPDELGIASNTPSTAFVPAPEGRAMHCLGGSSIWCS